MESKLAKEIENIGMEKGIKKGMEKGMEKGKRETAKNLKKLGIDNDKIAKATGLSKEEIKTLKP